MSQTERPTTLRGNNGGRRSPSRPSSKRSAGPGPRPTQRSKRNATEGGRVYGGLVAGQRVRLGLTQSQLAARMHTSRSSVARIEQGRLPDAGTQRRLSLALNPQRGIGPVRRLVAWVASRRGPGLPQGSHWLRSGIGPVHRLAARVAARRRLGLPHGFRLHWSGIGPVRRLTARVVARGRLVVPHGSRWVWSGVVVVVLVSMLMVLDGGSSNVGPAPSSLQPTIAASDALSVPAAIHRARVRAAKKAGAARIAADRAAAATAGGAPANKAHRGILATSHPVTEPGSPSSGGGAGGGGGGGSGGSGADVTDHGVGSHGGNPPQGSSPSPSPAPSPPPPPATSESGGGGGSAPAPPPSCVLPGILC